MLKGNLITLWNLKYVFKTCRQTFLVLAQILTLPKVLLTQYLHTCTHAHTCTHTAPFKKAGILFSLPTPAIVPYSNLFPVHNDWTSIRGSGWKRVSTSLSTPLRSFPLYPSFQVKGTKLWWQEVLGETHSHWCSSQEISSHTNAWCFLEFGTSSPGWNSLWSLSCHESKCFGKMLSKPPSFTMHYYPILFTVFPSPPPQGSKIKIKHKEMEI